MVTVSAPRRGAAWGRWGLPAAQGRGARAGCLDGALWYKKAGPPGRTAWATGHSSEHSGHSYSLKDFVEQPSPRSDPSGALCSASQSNHPRGP